MEVIDYSDYYFRKGKLHETSAFNRWYYRLLRSRYARRFARNTKNAIQYTMNGLGKEAKETKDMAHLFFRMLENKLDLHNRTTPPTRQEVKDAIEQLKDIGRISVFATISLLPGGGFSLIGLELLARKFGIKTFTFVPSSFRREQNPKEKDQNNT